MQNFSKLPQRSFKMPPSHNPIFLGTPASCLLLSLRLDATQGDSALGRAFTCPSLSPGDACAGAVESSSASAAYGH